MNAKVTDFIRARVRELWPDTRLQVKTIALKLGVSDWTVRNIAREEKLPKRKPGRTQYSCTSDTGGLCVHSIAYRGRLESVRQRFQGAW